MLFVFLLFSYSVSACDTGAEIRKIHDIHKQQQSQILKILNENKSLKAENILLRKDMDKLHEFNSRRDHIYYTTEKYIQKDVLQKREGNKIHLHMVKVTISIHYPLFLYTFSK